MHWIIQKSIFKAINLEILVEALTRSNCEFTLVEIPSSKTMVPDYPANEHVYVCGAIRMATLSREKNWQPGSFLTNQLSVDIWSEHLPKALLNDQFEEGVLSEIQPAYPKFFIRPLSDNKAFNGQVMDIEQLNIWRKMQSNASMLSLPVVFSPVKEILSEYRIFIVKNKYVTGSLYKRGGVPYLSTNIENDVLECVEHIINTWLPVESVVLDLARTRNGLKIIEFNNINSSGFYACDVRKYVHAIESAYGI